MLHDCRANPDPLVPRCGHFSQHLGLVVPHQAPGDPTKARVEPKAPLDITGGSKGCRKRMFGWFQRPNIWAKVANGICIRYLGEVSKYARGRFHLEPGVDPAAEVGRLREQPSRFDVL